MSERNSRLAHCRQALEQLDDGLRGPRRTAWKHVVGTGLTLLGFAWVVAGVFDLLRGAIALS